MEKTKKEKFVIIDGNAIIHRAFHALPPMTASTGEQVNAVYGFASMLIKILDIFNPEYLAVSFDVAGGTFRDQVFTEYKAKRVKAGEELYNQIPLVYKLVEALNIPIYTKKGYEADDVIGSLAQKMEKQKWNGETIIVTGDVDLLQLASENIKICLLKKGLSDIETLGPKEVKEKLGFASEFLVDYKSLKGDVSDNIPGVKGIGDKMAKELIEKVGGIKEIYNQIDELKEKGFSERVVEILKKDKEGALLSQKLAQIVTDIEIDFSLEDCSTKNLDKDAAIEYMRQLNFTSLIKRLLKHFGSEEKNDTKSEKIERITSKNFDKVFEKINKQTNLVCCEVLNNDDIFSAKILGFVLGIRENLYFFDFEDLLVAQKKIFFTLFEDDKKIFVGHNLKRLVKILLLNNVEIKGGLFDLMIASYLVNSSTRAHDLESIVARELGREIKGTNQTSLFGDNLELVSKGVNYFFELFDLYHNSLKTQKNDDLFHKLEMPLLKILAQMELNGIKLDKNKLKKVSVEVDTKLEELSEKIWKLAGKKFNIASSVQLREVLFTDLELSRFGIKKGKTGYSTAAAELAKIREMHEIVPFIEDHREYSKLKNTYTDVLPTLINPKSGRIHTEFNQAVTSTGRLSSSDPNLQNIPIRSEIGKDIRSSFVAEGEYKLISADYSQIELRIAASLSGDKKMIEIFKAGKDIHRATAAVIGGIKEEEVTKAMRAAAKSINFGVLYGMGSYGLSGRTGLSEEEAREFIDKYFQEFSGVREYLDKTLEFAHKNGYVETFFGRRRYLAELKASNRQARASGERMAINMPIQGTAADIMKIAMLNINEFLSREFKKDEVKMLLQVHDELIFEVKKEIADKVAEVVKKVMETNIYFGKTLLAPIVVEVSIADNWGDLK